MPADALFPVPRSARFSKEHYDYSAARWVIVAPSYSSVFKAHALTFCSEIRELFGGSLQLCAGAPSEGGLLLRISPPSHALPAQGYELVSTREGVLLSAGDEAGAFYGLQTLSQLVSLHGPVLPRFMIRDEPDFPQRGVMLDISRCKAPTMATLESLVDLFAQLKINQFQLYTEHTFAYAGHQPVWHDASPVTAEEIIALDGYCRDRYIELVPNQNSFGHFERWLRHPEYRHLAECPDGFDAPWGHHQDHGSTLRPNSASLKFLDGLYEELLPNFGSRLFNVGCDETWELGQGASAKKAAEHGATRVYLDFLLKINKLVRKHKRRMMFWGDIILHNPELIHEIPQDMIALEWGYDADHAFGKRCRHFAKAGVPFYVCPGTSSWNSLVGRSTNCLGNVWSAAKNGLKHGAIGYLNTDWGDGGHHQYLPISYQGYLAGAAYSWCGRTNRNVDIVDALNRLVFGDATGATGAVLHDMGKVCERVPVAADNQTVFNNLLFAGTDWLIEHAGEYPRRALRACLSEFDHIEENLRVAQPACPDSELVKAELRNAIAMARVGTMRMLAASGDQCDMADLRHRMQRIVGQHETLWLARNRGGGLRESSSRLREVLEQLKGC